MGRRTWTLAFILVATAIALALALSGPTSYATGVFTVPDPAGDTFGEAESETQHDIILVSGSSDDTSFILTVEFVNPISPPPGSMAARSAFGTTGTLGFPSDALVGYVDFDTDQDEATWEVGRDGISNVTENCPDPSDMGMEAYLSFDGYDPVAGTTPLVTAGGPVDVPVAFAANSFTATIPLSELGGDLNFNFGLVIGNLEEPTDCAPGDGGFIKPILEKATPTPTGTPPEPPGPTETGPAPTSTVAAVVSLPETGHGPSNGTPTTLWALLGAGALASAGAALRAFRRSST